MNIRNILMVASLALSVLAGLVIGRGHAHSITEGGGSKGLVIGLSLDTLKEARWQNDRDFFVKRATELGAHVDVQSANSDDGQQIRDVESLLTSGAKIIVIAPHDGVAMAKAVEMAHKAGVPAIAYDRLIKNCDLDLYLSFDNEAVGQAQAQFLADKIKPGTPLRLVRIYGAPTDNNARLFKSGQDKVLAPLIASGAVKIVHEDWAEDWKPENAKRIMNAALTDVGGNFDAVLASNDGTAGGAIQALAEAGLAGKILVTGQDADLAACQRIAGGSQTMTIYKPLKLLASQAAEAAVTMAEGKPLVARNTVNNGKVDVPSILEPVYTVTKENIRDTVIKEGFHSPAEIYGDAAAAKQ